MWLVPSFIAAAISVSIIGIVLGPMYPIAIHHTTRVLPHHLVSGTVGWMSAFGQAGSAILPFITGTMAAKFGIQSLQPLCVNFLSFSKKKKKNPRSHSFFIAFLG